jgi:hypothetical protein
VENTSYKPLLDKKKKKKKRKKKKEKKKPLNGQLNIENAHK